MFSRFPNRFLPFHMVVLHVSLSVSPVSPGVSPVLPQCFPYFIFYILQFSILAISTLRFPILDLYIPYFCVEKNIFLCNFILMLIVRWLSPKSCLIHYILRLVFYKRVAYKEISLADNWRDLLADHWNEFRLEKQVTTAVLM